MTKEFVCIVCPSSCRLTVTACDGEIQVTGNACRRGQEHGMREFTAPTRMLSATVSISDAAFRRLPVISTAEIPKDRMAECLREIYAISVRAPVRCGDVIVSNIGDTGVDIVSSRTMERIERSDKL